jgi:hypothetical protein
MATTPNPSLKKGGEVFGNILVLCRSGLDPEFVYTHFLLFKGKVAVGRLVFMTTTPNPSLKEGGEVFCNMLVFCHSGLDPESAHATHSFFKGKGGRRPEEFMAPP